MMLKIFNQNTQKFTYCLNSSHQILQKSIYLIGNPSNFEIITTKLSLCNSRWTKYDLGKIMLYQIFIVLKLLLWAYHLL